MIDRGMLSEALWETMQDYGVRWPVADQVAVERDLERGRINAMSVNAVIYTRGLSAPRGFSAAVAKRYRALAE